MLKHKNTDRICVIVLIMSLLFSWVMVYAEEWGITAPINPNSYETKLFGTLQVGTFEIQVDPEDWANLLANASEKEYIPSNLTIDGEIYHNIAIRTKGNSSLQMVNSSDSNRYSFKIEFDHYDNTQSYHGLDKICLNNIIQDNTYMKDYLAYTMMGEFGVASPLVNYTQVTVNGEPYGLYLAVEAIEEAFLQRNYGTTYGIAYKPETTDMGGGNNHQNQNEIPQMGNIPQMDGIPQGVDVPQTAVVPQTGNHPQMGTQPEAGEVPQRDQNPSGQQNQRPQQQGGGMVEGTLNSAMEYIDDNFEHYSYIFENNVIDISNSDKTRLLSSLQQLNAQENLEEVLDIEAIIRYFVVHNFVLNFDSYTGSIMHNYYLYEKNGVLSLLPWDYNLSYVAFMTSYNTQELVNFPIDTPVSSGTVEQRPMLTWIFDDPSYTALYHEIYAEFLEQFFGAGDLVSTIRQVEALIDPYVAEDPTKFCTYDQFQQGVDALESFVVLRSESIAGQLEGSIPSTAQGQGENPSALITTGTLQVTDTGSAQSNQQGGGQQTRPTQSNLQPEPQALSPEDGGMPGGMPEGMTNGGGMPNGGMAENMAGRNPMGDSPTEIPLESSQSSLGLLLASILAVVFGIGGLCLYKKSKL